MASNDASKWILEYQEAPWSVFRREAPQASDYAGRDDFIAGFTVVPELWEAYFNGASLRDVDLALADEVFCYLKIDGVDGLEMSLFADREEIEDCLNMALMEANVGCVLGGGTGFRYSYVDFAVNDLELGISVVRQSLQAGRITRRSWIFRFDSTKQNEWFPIWNDSPEPFPSI